jgi:hypothetical protein
MRALTKKSSIEEKSVEVAEKRRQEFVKFDNTTNLVKMKMIYEIWKNQDYRIQGFNSFREYVEAPVKLGGLEKSRSWCVEMARIYDKYVVELGLNEEKVASLSHKKLYTMISIASTETVNDIINKAENLTFKDLVLDKKDINELTCNHQWEDFRHCKICDVWEKI